MAQVDLWSPSARLTARELGVLRATAEGRTAQEVAEGLGLSVHTVRTHRRNAVSKLDARSTFEAVMLAVRAGLIDVMPLRMACGRAPVGGAAVDDPDGELE